MRWPRSAGTRQPSNRTHTSGLPRVVQSTTGSIVIMRGAPFRLRPGVVPFSPRRIKQGPVLSIEQFRGARGDDAMQAISFQPVAFLGGRNEESEEIAFIGFLMEVAAVRVLKPELVDDLVDNLLMGHSVLLNRKQVPSGSVIGFVPRANSFQSWLRLPTLWVRRRIWRL